MEETPIEVPNTPDGVFVVLASPELHEILSRSRRQCLLHEEFLTLPQPSGWSPEETWRLLKAIRRKDSIEAPIRTPQGYRLQYYLHQDLLNRLFDFERYCRPESDLTAQLADREGQPFLVKIQVEEAIATSTLDGVSIPYPQAESLIRLERKPKDGGERIIANTYRAMADIANYIGERFSPELMWEFYNRITEGVDSSTIVRAPVRSPLARKEYRQLAGQHPERHMADICAYANDEIGDPDEHPVIRAFLLRGTMRQWFPLPDWNGSVGSLLYRLYCLKHQYPVLAYLPFSRAVLDWDEGRIRPPHVLTDEIPKQYVDREGNEDDTARLTLAVQLVHHETLELLHYTRVRKERDERMVAALQNDPSLNHRQRSILSRALRYPDADFNIRYHRTNHNITYATARVDLHDLVDKGYLLTHKSKNTLVFRPHHDLRVRVQNGGHRQSNEDTELENVT